MAKEGFDPRWSGLVKVHDHNYTAFHTNKKTFKKQVAFTTYSCFSFPIPQ